MRNYRVFFVFLFFNLILNLYRLQLASAQEDITITTYYPSPNGSYDKLTANQMKIGSGYFSEATVFKPGGLLVEGSVGIGTAEPKHTLHVNSVFNQGQIGISGLADGNNTYSAIYLHDDTADNDNNWVIAHKKSIGDSLLENALAIARWHNVGAVNYSMIIKKNMDVIIPVPANVGIGTTNPLQRLHVVGTGGWLNLAKFANTNDNYETMIGIGRDSFGSGRSGYVGFQDNSDTVNGYLFLGVAGDFPPECLVVKKGGNVGIGTTNPICELDVGGEGVGAGGSEGYIHVAGKNVGPAVTPNIAYQGAYMSWNASGNAGETDFYNNDGVAALAKKGGFRFYNTADDGVTTKLLMNLTDDGVLWVADSVSEGHLSDVRLKKNVIQIKSSLASLLKLRGVTFEWKDPQNHANSTGKQIGFIAQEVEKVFPDWVTHNSEGYLGISTKGFEALTVESLRELKAENDELRKEIELLKARLK